MVVKPISIQLFGLEDIRKQLRDRLPACAEMKKNPDAVHSLLIGDLCNPQAAKMLMAAATEATSPIVLVFLPNLNHPQRDSATQYVRALKSISTTLVVDPYKNQEVISRCTRLLIQAITKPGVMGIDFQHMMALLSEHTEGSLLVFDTTLDKRNSKLNAKLSQEVRGSDVLFAEATGMILLLEIGKRASLEQMAEVGDHILSGIPPGVQSLWSAYVDDKLKPTQCQGVVFLLKRAKQNTIAPSFPYLLLRQRDDAKTLIIKNCFNHLVDTQGYVVSLEHLARIAKECKISLHDIEFTLSQLKKSGTIHEPMKRFVSVI